MPYYLFSDTRSFKSNEGFSKQSLAMAELNRMKKSDPAGQWQIGFRPGLTVEPTVRRKGRGR